MKFTFSHVALAVTLLAAAPVAHAQAAAEAPATLSYDALFKGMKALPLGTATEALQRQEELGGRVIELRGVVRGLMQTVKGRTCLLQIGQQILPLNAPASLQDSGLLRPNVSLRVLVLVGFTSSDVPFSILALSNAPAPAAPAAEEAWPTATVVEPKGPLFTDDGLTVAPPMTDMILPQPGSDFAPATKAVRPAPRRSPLDAQKPFYKALARRHNPNLSEAQLEEISTAIIQAGYANNMDPRFLAAIIAVESSFDPFALSRSGAMGLGQIMPFNLKSLGIQNAWNPTQNIHGSARMLRQLLNQFARQPDGTLLAVAAYNAGPNAVKRAGNRVPGGAQVQGYVWKVYERYKSFAPDMFQ